MSTDDPHSASPRGDRTPPPDPERRVRVLIADDDELMRAGLKAVLESDRRIAVIATAADGSQAIAHARSACPDVILMDVRMPGLDGIAATRTLTAELPESKVLMLTTFEEDDYIFGGLRAGASGFLLKRTSPEELIAAVHVIASGESLLSPSVTKRVIDRMSHVPSTGISADARLTLTPRETEVLTLLAEGLSNAEIAQRLYIEPTTAKTHVKRVLQKLELRDRVQAVIYAYESGLVR